jgi:hypothetical protein
VSAEPLPAGVEWVYLRWALVAVGVVLVAWVVGWGIHAAVTEESTTYDRLVRCLRNEKGATLTQPRDPVARSADLGSVRTTIETNGVTVSVSSSPERAERVVAAYRAVAGDLEGRLEQRDTAVYLWDRPASPTQRQTLFDCTN